MREPSCLSLSPWHAGHGPSAWRVTVGLAAVGLFAHAADESRDDLGIWIKKLESAPETHDAIPWADGSLQNRGSQTQGGHLVGLGQETADGSIECNIVSWMSAKIKRVCSSTYDSETLSVCRASEDGVTVALMHQEMLHGRLPSITERVLVGFRGESETERKTRVRTFSDGGGTVSTVRSSKMSGTRNKRRIADVAGLREMYSDTSKDSLEHIPGDRNPSDPLTKRTPLADFKKKGTISLLWRLLRFGTWKR